MKNNLPSPADKIITEFVDKILEIEPKFVTGIYLTGSISMNDFYTNKSDIDFIVLCSALPGSKTFVQLQHIHKTISKRFSKPDLSGVYVASDSIPTHLPTDIDILSFHEGTMRYKAYEMAPVSLWELKSNAITVFGQEAKTLPIELRQEDVNRFLHDNINAYWTKWLKGHSSWFNRKLLLLFFPRLTEWSVLGVARQLYTLQTGKIGSKTEAGLYCLPQLPDRFHPIIREALDIRKDNRTHPLVRSYAIRPSFRRLTHTIECMKYIIFVFNSIYHDSNDKQSREYGNF